MRPSEALPQDWGLYYNGTYMEHVTKGPVLVTVSRTNGTLSATAVRGLKTKSVVQPEDLSVWFPEKGAFNTRKGATYIARRALRQMRKSLTLGDLYYCTMGEHLGAKGMIELLAQKKRSLTPARTALKQVYSGEYTGRAVSKDLIILGGTGINPSVYYKGFIHAGTYDPRKNMVYMHNPHLSITNIIQRELEQGGIRCTS